MLNDKGNSDTWWIVKLILLLFIFTVGGLAAWAVWELI